MENDSLIILSILSGTLFTFVLILTIVLVVVKYQKNKVNNENKHKEAIQNKELEMLKRVIETQETEREKIAANIHDEIHPLLVTLKWSLEQELLELKKKEIENKFVANQLQMATTIIDNLHTATRDLSPRVIYKFGLVRAINSFLINIEELEVNYDYLEDKTVILPEIVSLNLYRIFLELINNIRKHENANRLDVFISITQVEILLTIKHAGEGMSNEQFEQYAAQSKGIGLNSIISRVKLLGARLDFKQEPTPEIVLAVPLIHARED